MTTVACNLHLMAADSKVGTDEPEISFQTEKLFRIGDSIFGICGDGNCWRFISWAKSGFLKDDRPLFFPDDSLTKGDFEVLELAPDGIFVWDETLFRIPIIGVSHYAVGTGSKVAVYCMKFLGLSPDAAVKEASKVDEHTDNLVKIMRL